MSENRLVLRIRRILNLEDRSMRVSAKSLGLGAAVMVFTLLLVCLCVQQAKPDAGTPDPIGASQEKDPPKVSEQDDPTAPPTKKEDPNKRPGRTTPKPKEGGDVAPGAEGPGVTKSSLDLPGRAEAMEMAGLRARITGIVQMIQVDIGDQVKQGQVLIQLATPELKTDLAQKVAGVRQATAQLQVARLSNKVVQSALAGVQAQLAEAEAKVKATKALVDFRKRQLERYQQLIATGAVSQHVLDEAKLNLETATASLANAEAKLPVTRAATEEASARLLQAEAGVKVAEAQLAIAEADVQRVQRLLQFATIKAPFDGVILRRNVAMGDLVQFSTSKGETLLVVARTNIIRVVVEVPENLATKIRKGMPAKVRFAALGRQQYDAQIVRLAGEINPKTGTLQVELLLRNPEGRVMPGMFAVVSLTLDK
jgi:multidrug resistance efflux pump